MRKRLLYVIFMTFLVTGCGLYVTQESSKAYQEVALNTQNSMTGLSNKINGIREVNVKSSFQQLENAHQKLFTLLEECNRQYKIEADYLATLIQSQKALEKVLTNTYTPEKTIQILEGVTNDYKAKTKSVVPGPKTNIVPKLDLVVQTSISQGYKAYVKYSFDFDTDIVRFEFNNPTNNAKTKLAPGYYIVWIEKGDFKSEGRKVEISSEDLDNNIIIFEN